MGWTPFCLGLGPSRAGVSGAQLTSLLALLPFLSSYSLPLSLDYSRTLARAAAYLGRPAVSRMHACT